MANVSENPETVLHLEFSGGLDSLTLNQERELQLKIYGNGVNLGQLIAYVRKNVIGAKKDFFSFASELNNTRSDKVKVESDHEDFSGLLSYQESCKIRPGVLVLVNDVDWELLQKEDTVLQNNQRITFISTLHGG